MSENEIQPGELLAYLDGEHLPQIEAALHESPELQDDLASLRRTELFFRHTFGGVSRPNPQDLVDVATGQATAAQQLRVAAYTRGNAAVQGEMDALRAAYETDSIQAKPRRRSFSEFFALPISAAVGVRSGGQAPPSSTFSPGRTEQTYYAVELQAHVSLRVVPVAGERWQLAGQVTRARQPVPDARVTILSTVAHPRPRYTDSAGFFEFSRLMAGKYRLRVDFDQSRLVIPDIILSES